MGYLLSIIVPVYNAEKYLKKCVDSILCQKYTNFELILVDDGSLDSSHEICTQFARLDPRVRTAHTENRGPSAARKLGFDMSGGEYIAFVDADDYLDPRMYEILIDRLIKEDADIVQCGYFQLSKDGRKLVRREMKRHAVCGRYESSRFFAMHTNISGGLWNKLFRRIILEGAEFPNLFHGEDGCVSAQAYSRSEKSITIPDSLYFYLPRPGGLCAEAFSPRSLDSIKTGEFIHGYYERTFPELNVFVNDFFQSAVIGLAMTADRDKERRGEHFTLIKDIVNSSESRTSREKRREFRNLGSLRRYLAIELFKISPRLMASVFRAYSAIRAMGEKLFGKTPGILKPNEIPEALEEIIG